MSPARFTLFCLLGAQILPSSAAVKAGPIVQPVGATTDIQTSSLSSPDNVRSQSGLSASYMSLATNFDDYLATQPTHEFASQSDIWNGYNGGSGPPPFPGNFDLDLGGSFVIESMALWNFGGDQDANLVGFTLFVDDNAAFSSPELVGQYAANPNTGPLSAVAAEVFSFSPIAASFVRMRITSNHGDGANVVFGEVAFEAVPEPAPIIQLAIGAMGLVGVRLNRCGRKRAEARPSLAAAPRAVAEEGNRGRPWCAGVKSL